MSAVHLGFYNTSSTRTHVRFQFSTHAAAGGNVAPNSAFEAADLRIYRANDGAAFSATQRSSSNGITMTSPFDSLTGFHDVDIDLTDNTDSGFYASGYQYSVVLSPDETVDGQTLTGVVLAYFEIGVPVVSVSSHTTAAKAEINAEVLDVLNVDTFSEPGQGVLPATPTIRQMAHYLFKVLRNRKRASGSVIEIYADNGTTVDHKIAHTETAGVYEKPEIVSGP